MGKNKRKRKVIQPRRPIFVGKAGRWWLTLTTKERLAHKHQYELIREWAVTHRWDKFTNMHDTAAVTVDELTKEQVQRIYDFKDFKG